MIKSKLLTIVLVSALGLIGCTFNSKEDAVQVLTQAGYSDFDFPSVGLRLIPLCKGGVSFSAKDKTGVRVTGQVCKRAHLFEPNEVNISLDTP